MYVLIVVTSVYYGVTVSQQEYRGLAACETAAAAVTEMVAQRRSAPAKMYVTTRCVPKAGEHQ
jgi:hypothetical protein